MRYLFGEFALDPDREELRGFGRPIPLGPVGFPLLLHLLRNRHRLVGKKEIHEVIWGGRNVGSSTIPTAISALRGALNDPARQPRFIQSVYSRGYRFVGEVREIEHATDTVRPEILRALDHELAAPFVGRERELRMLREAAATRQCPVTVSGEAGAGKTRLLERLASLEASSGTSVLFGRCSEVGDAAPYSPIVDLLRQLERIPGRGTENEDRLSEAVLRGLEDPPETMSESTVGSGSTGVDGRFRVLRAIASVFETAPPLIVIVDDFHRIDLASAQAVRFFLPRADNLLLVLAYRGGELRPDIAGELGAITRVAGSIDLTLGGMRLRECASLVESRLGTRVPERLARRLRKLTGGNPFFLTKVADLLRQQGVANIDLEDVELPRATRDAVIQHTAGLSDDCQQVVVAGSVLGREFDRRLLRAVLGWSVERFESALEEAAANGVVSGKRSVRFSHVLLRDALYESNRLNNLRIHGQAFLAFDRLYGEPPGARLSEKARHAVLAGGEISARARCEACAAAARWASEKFAFSEAAVWYLSALEVIADGDEIDEYRRCDLLIRLAESQHRSDCRADGQDSARRAFTLARQLSDATLMARAALAYSPGFFAIEVGVVDSFLVEALEEAAACLEESSHARLKVEVLARLAMALYWTNDRGRRAQLADEAVRRAQQLGGSIVGYAITAREVALWDSSRPKDKEAVARAAVKMAVDADEHELELVYRLYRISNLLQMGKVGQAASEIGSFKATASLVGHSNSLWFSDLFDAMSAMIVGDRMKAAVSTDRFVEKGQLVGDRNADHCRVVHRVYQKMEFGPIGDAADIASEQWKKYRRVGAYRCSMPFLYWESGEKLAARVAFEELAREGFASIPRNVEWLIGMAMLSEGCAVIGDRRRAAELHELLRPHSDECVVVGFGVAVFRPVAHFLGRLAATMGKFREAEEHFSRAFAIADAAGSRPWRAHAEYGLSDLLARRRRPGDLGRAEALLEACLEKSRVLGMRPLEQRAERLRTLVASTA